jgi:hypothetical protein
MKARHPSSRDCFDYRIKGNEVKDVVTEETTSNELTPNLVGVSAIGFCVGVENGKTK